MLSRCTIQSEWRNLLHRVFQVSYGRQWFIHCFYTVRSKSNAARIIGKRSVTSEKVVAPSFDRSYFRQPTILNSTLRAEDNEPPEYDTPSLAQAGTRIRRSLGDRLATGEDGRGTNMNPIILNYNAQGYVIESSNIFGRSGGVGMANGNDPFAEMKLITIGTAVSFALLFVISSVALYVTRRKRTSAVRDSPVPTVIRYSERSRVVVRKKYFRRSEKDTEV